MKRERIVLAGGIVLIVVIILLAFNVETIVPSYFFPSHTCTQYTSSSEFDTLETNANQNTTFQSMILSLQHKTLMGLNIQVNQDLGWVFEIPKNGFIQIGIKDPQSILYSTQLIWADDSTCQQYFHIQDFNSSSTMFCPVEPSNYVRASVSGLIDNKTVFLNITYYYTDSNILTTN